MRCFRLNRETWSGVLCLETVIRRILNRLSLKATRITCSIRQDQTCRSKNFMSIPSIRVIYNDKRKSKDWRFRTHSTDLLNLDENKFDYKKTCLWNRKFSEILKSEICTKWEKLKRAQELRVDEVSVQKLRETHETIQQLTSQLQQMQQQMNSMNESGDFQDVKSNCSGKLSDVSSQPVMIPSSRSLLSRDTRLPLDTWNQSGLQENVFGN